MQAEVEVLEGIKRRVALTVDRDTVTEETDRVLEQAQKEVAVKGFRKGTAPKQIVRNQLGDFINAEVTSRLAYQAISDFVRDFGGGKIAGLPVVVESDRPSMGRRYVGELNIDGTFTVHADFEMEPELEVEGYVGLEVSSKKPDPEAWIDRTLAGVQDQFAQLQPSEDPAKEGDQLTLEFEADGEISTVVLNDKLDPQVYNALLGKKAGETFEVDETEKGTVHSVDVKELPELNDELAQLAGYESLEQMRSDIKLRAENEYAGPEKAKLIEELTTQLIEKNDFEVPQAWLDNEINMMAQRLGLKELPKDPEQVRALKELAERSVRRSFILDRIYVAEESIHLSTDELYTLAQVEAQRHNLDVESYLTLLKNNQRYEAFVSFHEQVRAVDFLVDSAVVKEQ